MTASLLVWTFSFFTFRALTSLLMAFTKLLSLNDILEFALMGDYRYLWECDDTDYRIELKYASSLCEC